MRRQRERLDVVGHVGGAAAGGPRVWVRHHDGAVAAGTLEASAFGADRHFGFRR